MRPTITETNPRTAAAPLRRCITDRSRSPKQLYLRLATWISRDAWETFRAGRAREAEMLFAELHYLRRHLIGKRSYPCPGCPYSIRLRLERQAQ